MTAGPVMPALRLTAAWVAAKMRGTLEDGEPRGEFARVDRHADAAAGELFVAIRGERFDGADFARRRSTRAPAAWSSRGAARPAPRTTAGGVVIEVDDTTAALQALAHACGASRARRSWPSPAAPARPRRRK
jgi:UDP-N-acetylmuramyl pentapeptide synthase